jgi:methylated-DNA-[protein]-cysteine S-methyltransferase
MTMQHRDSCSVAHMLFDTGLGICGMAWSERGVTRLQLPERDRSATAARLGAGPGGAVVAPPPGIASVIADVIRYLGGESIDFLDVPLDLVSAPSFHRTVFAATRTIRWGETISYGALADRVGSPGAARAVGQAMSRNPIPIIIPCHRVLARDNRIGGFSAHGGTLTKERLLALEGVLPGDGTPLLPGLFPDRP